MPLARSCFMLGLTSSGILSGLLLGVSAATIPALLAAPAASEQLVLAQWKRLYHHVSRTAAAASLVTVTCHAINAYNLYHKSYPQRSVKFVAASGLILSIIPATEVFIRPTINALFVRAGDAEQMGREGSRVDGSEVGAMELMEKLGRLNWIRFGLAIASTFLAFDAL